MLITTFFLLTYVINMLTTLTDSCLKSCQFDTTYEYKYSCDICNYNTNKKSSYDKHKLSNKHTKLTASKLLDVDKCPYTCKNCHKNYKSRVGLWKHKKTCTYTNENTVITISNDQSTTSIVEKKEDMPDMKELIIALMTQNQNMQKQLFDQQAQAQAQVQAQVQTLVEAHAETQHKQLLELMPHLGNTSNTTNNNTMSNSNNKTNNFNVNMFLNEHCQNAMNISDFIESLPITHQELDNTRKYGLSESISNMVIKGLDDMSIYERPIHCTDPSRKTVYVRDNDEWVKDDNNVIMQRNAVRLAVKQRNNVKLWRDQYLEGKESDRTHLDYHDMALNCLKYIETDEKEKNKIVKKICQATHLTVDVKQKLMAIH